RCDDGEVDPQPAALCSHVRRRTQEVPDGCLGEVHGEPLTTEHGGILWQEPDPEERLVKRHGPEVGGDVGRTVPWSEPPLSGLSVGMVHLEEPHSWSGQPPGSAVVAR